MKNENENNNSWQLGWYDDRRTVMNFRGHVGSWRTKLVGVNDYNHTTYGRDLVSMKVFNPTGDDVYIGFNRMVGINADTAEAGDLVTVHTKERTVSGSLSYLVFSGTTDSSYTYKNFGNMGYDLTVHVNDIDTTNAVWRADVTIKLE